MNKLYGFEGEIVKKYDDGIYDLFCEIFNCLPLGIVLNKKVFICHGGLFAKDGVTIAEVQKINRFLEIPDSGPMTGNW